VLDVGCGGGAAGLALADRARVVIGVDSRADMLAEFQAAADRLGVGSQAVEGNWPDVADHVPTADVVVCHHVFYNVADLVPFVQALTSHARGRVVVELPKTHPTSRMSPLWEHFWGVVRPSGPTADDAISVLREIGIEPEVATFTAPARRLADFDAEVEQARRHVCLPPERADEVAALLQRQGPPVARQLYALCWPGAA
jgi:SAM-dependent methyltransferase